MILTLGEFNKKRIAPDGSQKLLLDGPEQATLIVSEVHQNQMDTCSYTW